MWNNEEKNQVRSLVCRKRQAVYESILLLPSTTMLDFKELLDNGQITPEDTVVTCVERDPAKAEVIKATLEASGFSYKVLVKDLSQVDLIELADSYCHNFDFIYADTCSQLNPDILRWLVNLSRNRSKIMTANGVLTLAFCPFQRQGAAFAEHFWQYCAKSNSYKHFDLSDREADKLRRPEISIGNITEYQARQHQTIKNLLFLLFGTPQESYQYRSADSKTAMSVLEFVPRSCDAPHIKFVEDVLATYRPTSQCRPIVVQTTRSLPLPKVPATKIKPEKVRAVAVKEPVDFIVDFRRHLAAWKMVHTKKNVPSSQRKKEIVSKTLQYVASKGFDPRLVDLVLTETAEVKSGGKEKLPASKIKQIRSLRRQGMSQNKVAEIVKVSSSTVFRYCQDIKVNV